MLLCTSSVSVINVNDGAKGDQGVSVSSSKEQWYLSTSSSQLTGGSWSYTEPNPIPDGKYLWGRWENTMSDGSKQYSTAVYRSTIQGLKNVTDSINNSITQKVWSSDITNAIDEYDDTTAQSIRDNVSQLTTDLSGITTRVGQAETTLTTKADGSTVTALQNDYSSFKQTMNGFKTTVESSYATIEDLNGIKVSGNNLYHIKDEIPGYLSDSSGGIINPSSIYKEKTSAYIPVISGATYIIQSWATTTQNDSSWLGYQFFADETADAKIGNRVSKYGSDAGSGVEVTAEGQEHLMFKAEAPENAKYLRVSYRHFEDGCCMVEQATVPSEYAIAPVDIEHDTDAKVSSVRTIAEQNAEKFSWIVEDGSTSSSVTYTSNALTAMANQIDLTGKVTFNSMNSALQNRFTTAETDASNAKSNASNAVDTANTANTNASNALLKVNASIKSTTMHYLATSASSGITTSTSGWTTTIQSITKDKPYLWTYQTITKINDTTSNTDPVISGVYGATGGKGDTGTGVTKVEQLYRISNSTTAPAAPTSAVSSTSTSYNTWTLAMPTYNTSYPYYYICTQTTYDNGTVKWTTVSRSKALEDANSTANTANTNASNAVSTANTANTNASNAVSTANTANTNASNAVTTANQAKSKADSAASLLSTWTGDATLATTTVDGGYIKTHTIESTHLATNAIMSQNYSRTDTSSPYSSTGAFLDLETGTLYMKNFGVNGTTGAAYFNGTVNANAGKFGDDTSYWNIETVYDYNMQPHAALVGTGSPYLQTGNWQVSDNAVATRKYTSTDESTGNATYYKDSTSNTFYDVGMKIPTNFGGYSASDSSVTRYNKAFYYGRKYTGNSVPSLDSDWTYFFEIDSGGNIITAGDVYEGGVKLSEKYAAITDVGSAYLPKTGGTITGNLTVDGSVTTNLMIQANLASTSAAQLTGAANAIVKPGVTGTLGVGNGGTGKTTALDAANAFITALPNWTATPTDNTYFIRRDTGGAASYGQVKFSTLWTYINNKITSEYDIANTYRRLDDNQFDTIDITDAQIGNLIVTGAARFTNGLYGTASEASKVTNALKIQLNGGTTEGTSQFTYDGSAVKNINITRSSIGLGAAADKAVDTSITAGSSSANLPTSAAVAAFVDGKGYVTSSGVTSVRVQATSPVVSSQNTAQSSTLNTTISLADSYGDTKNPYGTKTANYVLAGPTTGNAAAPSFRKLVADDIPTLTPGKAGLGNVTNDRQVKGLSSGTTSGHLVSWGANGYTVADSGIAVSSVNKTVKSLASNNDGKIVLTYLDGTTSDPIEVKIIGSSGSSVSYADALNVNGVAVGGAEQPVFINNQGKPQTANKIPKLNNGTTGGTFYAPTGAGTSGQVLTSSGGTPSWTNQSSLSVGTAANVSASAANANANRHVWFSDNTAETKRAYDDNFMYNPSTNTLTVTNISGNASSATKLTSGNVGDWSVPVYFNNGVPTSITYLNNHPENNISVLLPFINNDLAHLVQRGGSYEIYSTTSTSFTTININKTVLSLDLSEAFDGSYSYCSINRPQNETTVIDIVYPGIFDYTNRFYIDFGSDDWRAKNIQLLVCNSNTETSYVLKKSITDNNLGHWTCKISHTSTNSSGATVQGFNRLRIVLSGWVSTQNRIAQIGVVKYNSVGTRILYMSRGIDDQVYRSITPAKNNTYSLGSSTNNWANVYATTFYGALSGNAATATSATSATNATNATYLTHKTLNSTTINNTAGTFAFSGSGDPWAGCDWVGLQVGDSVDKFQLLRYNTDMIFRYNDSGGTDAGWSSWKVLLDQGNYSTYVVPKSGGTFTGEVISQTGGIWVQGNSAAGGNYNRMTLTSGMPDGFQYNNGKRGTKIYSNAISFADPYNGNSNNDAGWIRHIEETANDGTLEIATGDDANELIKVRQYNTSSVIAHEMTLLDSQGNTAISGKLTIGSSTSAAANTCQLVMNTSTHSLDFIFN